MTASTGAIEPTSVTKVSSSTALLATATPRRAVAIGSSMPTTEPKASRRSTMAMPMPITSACSEIQFEPVE